MQRIDGNVPLLRECKHCLAAPAEQRIELEDAAVGIEGGKRRAVAEPGLVRARHYRRARSRHACGCDRPATRPDQQLVAGTIGELPARLAQLTLERPVVVMLGGVLGKLQVTADRSESPQLLPNT